MRRQLLRTLALFAAAVALIGAGSAHALHLRAGNLIIDGDGGFSPTSLPKDGTAPVRVFFHGHIGTIDGARPSPLRRLVLLIDKHSAVETRGLPKCSRGQLEATTTQQARAACPGAIVGSGTGTGVVELPEQAPIKVSSPITIFNGPVVDGNPTGIGHAHLDYPGPTTYLVQTEIETIHKGRYGYRLQIDIPKLVNGYGSALSGRFTVNRKWRFHGKTLSYANAGCPDGRLQAHAELTFEDDTVVQGTAFKPCTTLK